MASCVFREVGAHCPVDAETESCGQHRISDLSSSAYGYSSMIRLIRRRGFWPRPFYYLAALIELHAPPSVTRVQYHALPLSPMIQTCVWGGAKAVWEGQAAQRQCGEDQMAAFYLTSVKLMIKIQSHHHTPHRAERTLWWTPIPIFLRERIP